MSFLELAFEFLAETVDPLIVFRLVLPAAGFLAALAAFALSSPSAAAVVLAPAGLFCIAAGWARARGRREAPTPVYLGTLPDAPVLVSGRVEPLVPGDTEAFVLDDGQGRALVWIPEEDEASCFPAGATVSLMGRAGSYEGMMGALAARGADVAPELFHALQTRADLRGLPCFWPGGEGGLRAALSSPEDMMRDAVDPGGALKAIGWATLVFAVVLFLGRAFSVF